MGPLQIWVKLTCLLAKLKDLPLPKGSYNLLQIGQKTRDFSPNLHRPRSLTHAN